MTEAERSDRKELFLAQFANSCGLVGPACQAAKISRSTYELWRREDADFDRACADVLEDQIDFVENAFLKSIKAGNVQAQIHYLKTRGRSRGYGVEPPAPAQPPAPVSGIDRLIADKAAEMESLLRGEGKWTADLSLQVVIAARLVVRADMLAGEVFAGNAEDRTETLYLSYSEKAQRALKALGMNTDSKERRGDGPDPALDFMEMVGRGDGDD